MRFPRLPANPPARAFRRVARLYAFIAAAMVVMAAWQAAGGLWWPHATLWVLGAAVVYSVRSDVKKRAAREQMIEDSSAALPRRT